jgi:hypothetical protein
VDVRAERGPGDFPALAGRASHRSCAGRAA